MRARRTFTDLAALLCHALLGALAEAKAVAAACPAEPLALTVADKRTECVDGGKWQTRHLISATASVICAASVGAETEGPLELFERRRALSWTVSRSCWW